MTGIMDALVGVIGSQVVASGPTPGPLQAYVAGSPAQNYPFDLSATNQITVVFKMILPVWSSESLVFEFTTNAGTTNGGFFLDDQTSSVMRATGLIPSVNNPTFPRPSAGVLHGVAISYDRTISSGNIWAKAWVDGVQQTMTAGSFTGGGNSTPFANDTLYMASRANSAAKWTGSESSPPAILTRLCTSAEGIAWST